MDNAPDLESPAWIAGFMSGTSLDAVDAAMIRTDGTVILDWGPATERKYSAAERDVLARAVEAARAWGFEGPAPERAFERARAVLTETHAEAFGELVSGWDGPAPVLAGVHGQTVLHRRPSGGRPGATLQLLDARALRERLGLPIAHDFRSDDVAAGGEGAPLAPSYHAALMDRFGPGPMAVLNLGGVANITARLGDGRLVAFDTGPANGPLDEWVAGHGRGTRDADGRYAAAGTVHEGLLAQLFEHPWFAMAPPKSLDRYDFNANLARGLSFEDGAATLTAFSARAVAAGIAQLPERPARVIACGGGRHNPTLMAMLEATCPCPVITAEAAGWRGDSIEAEAFAFLAARAVRRLPFSWPETTGVPQPLSGGRLLA